MTTSGCADGAHRMHQLVYVSTARWTMSNDDLNDILDTSRRNNRNNRITGLLLYIDQGFLQVLEGPEASIKETYHGHIVHDRRHTALRILTERETDRRLFAGWSMGFDRLSPDQARNADAFAITRDAIENVLPPGRAADIAVLLHTFYKINAGNFAA
jgi:hypothetical protein